MNLMTVTLSDTGSRTREDAARIARTAVLDALPGGIATVDQDPTDERAVQRRLIAAELRPPGDDDFAAAEDDFLDSAVMEALGFLLIEDWPEMRHIREAEVKFAWKRKGGRSKGAPVLGKCVPLSGPAKHFGEADFLIWLAADHVRDTAMGAVEIEALLYHELKHIGYELDEDEESPTYGELQIKAVGHDVEGFYDEIRRYGTWRDALRHAEHEFKQLALAADGQAA